MARKIPYRYDNCRGNVPTKPMGLADWVFLGFFAAIAIGLWVVRLTS